MKRFLGDALKNVFEETTMKNVQLTDFGVLNEETKFKIRIYGKN